MPRRQEPAIFNVFCARLHQLPFGSASIDCFPLALWELDLILLAHCASPFWRRSVDFFGACFSKISGLALSAAEKPAGLLIECSRMYADYVGNSAFGHSPRYLNRRRQYQGLLIEWRSNLFMNHLGRVRQRARQHAPAFTSLVVSFRLLRHSEQKTS